MGGVRGRGAVSPLVVGSVGARLRLRAGGDDSVRGGCALSSGGVCGGVESCDTEVGSRFRSKGNASKKSWGVGDARRAACVYRAISRVAFKRTN